MGEFGSAHCGMNEGKKNSGKKRTDEKKNSFIRFEVLRGKRRRRRRAICGMFWTEEVV